MSENLPPLPPLPRPNYHFACHTYTEDAMHAYARTACAPLEARIEELEERIRMALESIDENDPTGAAQVLRPALKKEAP